MPFTLDDTLNMGIRPGTQMSDEEDEEKRLNLPPININVHVVVPPPPPPFEMFMNMMKG